MPDAARNEDHRPHKMWKDAEGIIHKCEWLRIGDRKVPIAVTLCGHQPPPQATEPHEWDITCDACNAEIAARKARLIQG